MLVARRLHAARATRSSIARPSSSSGRCRISISRAKCSAARAFRITPSTRCRSPPSRSPRRSTSSSSSSRRSSRATRRSRCCDRRTSRRRRWRRDADGRARPRAERRAVSRRARTAARARRHLDGRPAARPALASCVEAAEALQPLLERAPASVQLARLSAFLDVARARAGVARRPGVRRPRSFARARPSPRILESLAAAHAAHDDRDATIDELAPDIRRWIEDETFVPESGGDGHPARRRPGRALRGLRRGGDRRADRRRMAGTAAPQHLLSARAARVARMAVGKGSPRRRDGGLRRSRCARRRMRVALSTFTLDDEALVEPSSLVDDLGRARLDVARNRSAAVRIASSSRKRSRSTRPRPRSARRRRGGVGVDADGAHAAGRRRISRPGRRPASAPAVGQRHRDVSRVPLQVLRAVRPPPAGGARRRRGDGSEEAGSVHPQGVSVVFRDVAGARRIARSRPDTLDAARALFSEIVEAHLDDLPEAEAALERTRLLGSGVAAGLGEVVFRMEAERPIEVVERLLEYELDGRVRARGPDGPRTVVAARASPIGSICSPTGRSG